MIDEKELIKILSRNSIFEGITMADDRNVYEIIDSLPKIDCSDCGRRKWYQIGFADGVKDSGRERSFGRDDQGRCRMRGCNLCDGYAKKLNEKWIPCSERLPEKYLHCLVTRRNVYHDGYDVDVREDTYIELEGEWGWRSQFEGLLGEIVAWQPLPEPYRGE